MMHSNTWQIYIDAGIFNKETLLHYPTHSKKLLKKEGVLFCLMQHLMTPDDFIKLSDSNLQKLEYFSALRFLISEKMNLAHFFQFTEDELLNLDSKGIQALIQHKILDIKKATKLNPLQKNILASYGVNDLLIHHKLTLTKALTLTLNQAMVLKSSWVLNQIKDNQLSIPQALTLSLNAIAKHIAHSITS